MSHTSIKLLRIPEEGCQCHGGMSTPLSPFQPTTSKTSTSQEGCWLQHTKMLENLHIAVRPEVGGLGNQWRQCLKALPPSWGAEPAASENPNRQQQRQLARGHFDLQDATGCTAQGLSSGVRGARGLGEGPGPQPFPPRGVTPASLTAAVSCEAEKPGSRQRRPRPWLPTPVIIMTARRPGPPWTHGRAPPSPCLPWQHQQRQQHRWQKDTGNPRSTRAPGRSLTGQGGRRVRFSHRTKGSAGERIQTICAMRHLTGNQIKASNY